MNANALVREIVPKFMPLNAPTVYGGGRVKQSTDAFNLKPLSKFDFIASAKNKVSDEHAQLTDQAQKLVAQTFYGTLLKQMHDSPFKTPWVDGGRGGQAFQPLLDQKFIDHLAKSGSGKKLVNTVVRKIERKRAYQKATKPAGVNDALIKEEHTTPTTNPTGAHVAAGLRA